jgi:hypothetical protein
MGKKGQGGAPGQGGEDRQVKEKLGSPSVTESSRKYRRSAEFR